MAAGRIGVVDGESLNLMATGTETGTRNEIRRGAEIEGREETKTGPETSTMTEIERGESEIGRKTGTKIETSCRSAGTAGSGEGTALHRLLRPGHLLPVPSKERVRLMCGSCYSPRKPRGRAWVQGSDAALARAPMLGLGRSFVCRKC